jgi:hypothetical protein
MATVRWSVRERRDSVRRAYLRSDAAAALCYMVCGLGFGAAPTLVLLLDPYGRIADVGDAAVFALVHLPAVAFLLGGGLWLRSSVAQLRPWEDRVWLEGPDLWWIRHHPARLGAEPIRVTVADIRQVRLADDDSPVVVRTVDGTDHPVTDLGTAAERGALVEGLSALVGSGTTRTSAEHPPRRPLRRTPPS